MDTLNDFIAENTEKLMNSVDLFERRQLKLDSVGCCFDVDTLLVYALTHDGNAHHYDGVHITDVTEEWINSLGPVDNYVLRLVLIDLVNNEL